MAQEATNKLIREDFDAGPSSYDEIVPGLFLGNLTAATDIDWLKEAKINYILTVDSCPIPRKIQEFLPNLTVKYIQITDMPREDLLTHFEDSYEFIDHALQLNNKILVHCYFGVSRSATIVIAYLMKKYRKSFCDTFEAVKEKRRFVGPNAGFLAQLKLYEEMGFGIDNTNIQFKMYRLQIAADKCRRIVASASNILPHMPKEKQIWRHISSRKTSKQSKTLREPLEPVEKEEQQPTEFCTKILFVEPLAWMPDITHNVEGKLNCPKCNTKLGSFSWIAGSQCPCGSKIAPAFYLVPSKVDWSNAVQNVQVTV